MTIEGARLSVALPAGRLVCIVRFVASEADPLGVGMPQRTCIHMQVTVDPAKCSAGGRFIRFGETQGDELMGWQRRDWLVVEEVLGELSEDGKTVVPLEREAEAA